MRRPHIGVRCDAVRGQADDPTDTDNSRLPETDLARRAAV